MCVKMKNKEEIQIEINKSKTASNDKKFAHSKDVQLWEKGYRKALRWVLENENEKRD